MKLRDLLGGVALITALAYAPAHAAPPQAITESVGVCDPWFPQSCSAPLLRNKVAGDQYGASIATALAPTIPSGALGILVIPVGTNNASGQCAMWRDDGTDPSGTVGNPISAGVPMWYFTKASPTSSAPLSTLRLIAATGATCVVNLLYYK